jgi:hypothetical protein
MTDLLNDLRFYGTTMNECPDVRGLLKRAATEIDRLGGLASTVKCSNCETVIERSGDWYRCFDCKAHLCERCVTKHFGETYAPHHRTMENYKQTIERLSVARKAAATSQAEGRAEE